MDRELARASQRWSTTDEEDHSAVGWDELNNRMGLNVDEYLAVEPFSAISGALHVVRGNYETSPLSRPLTWLFHGFYVNRFYRNDLLKLESTQSVE